MKYAVCVLTVVLPLYIDLVVVDIVDQDDPRVKINNHYSYIELDRTDYKFSKGAYRISGAVNLNNNGHILLSEKSIIEKLQYGNKISMLYIDEWVENL